MCAGHSDSSKFYVRQIRSLKIFGLVLMVILALKVLLSILGKFTRLIVLILGCFDGIKLIHK